MYTIEELKEMLETDFNDLLELIELGRSDTCIELIKEHMIPNLQELAKNIRIEDIIREEIVNMILDKVGE